MSLTISLSGVLRNLARLSNDPLKPWLANVAIVERKKVELRIKKLKTDPDGHAWAPWQPRTAQAREKKGNAGLGLLYDEGTLLASVVSRSSHVSAGVTINAAYAPFLHAGTPHMQARPLLGWDTVSLAQYELEAMAALEKLVR